jgi:2,5-dioxopentanoate dehydrogenase
MKLTGKNFIGKKQSSQGTAKYVASNPAAGTAIEPAFFEATTSEVDEAVLLAAKAFAIYSRTSADVRARFLEAIAEEIQQLGDVLLERCAKETGLPLARLTGERARTINQIKLFANYLRDGSWVDARIDHPDASRVPPKPDLRSMLVPLGPVGVFGASNFPLAFSVAGGDTISALAAGCTVVFKGHPAHPGTSEMVASAIIHACEKCQMPDGTFSLVNGKSIEVGKSLVQHPAISAIAFTGSFKGGKAIFDLANKRDRPIPVYAEMGSTNPVFILSDVLKERAESIAKDLVQSVTLGTGQFCTNPGLVMIPGEQRNFVSLLTRNFEDAACGLMLTSDIHSSFNNGIDALKSHGANVLAKGKEAGEGFSVSPHLFDTTGKKFLAETKLEEELFGPSTVIVHADDKKELLELAKKLTGHLTATVHGTETDLRDNEELLTILAQKVGRLVINGYPTGVEVAHAMVHGGPYPATTDSRTTSVGSNAMTRFARPLCFQNFPDALLPDALKESNPLGLRRFVDGKFV